MRWSRHFVISALVLAMLFQGATFLSPETPVALGQELEPLSVPGQLLVGFNPGVSKEEIANFYAEYGLTERDNLDVSHTIQVDQLRLAAAPIDVNDDLIQLLENDPRVRYAEPNYLVHISDRELLQAGTSQTDPPQAAPAADKPNDPRFDELWGLNNTGQTGGTAGAHISALRAWDVTTGSRDIIVFVIDTGVDYTHEDLNANMWTNPKECPKGPGKCEANGKDDDNNGYVDDFYGINAITDTGDPMDDFGHGTHVAGILGAVGNNSKGVVGVSHKVRIGACKFLSASGSGTVSGAIKCFNYINDLKNKQKQNILLTNNSWGGGGFSQALEDAMKGANQPLHICAAGNGNSSRSHYPAAFDLDHILSIAATDHDDLYASFSNYGPTWVDLAAPGVAIISTVPKSGCPLCSTTGYRSVNGTSMSTPYVSGAIALVKTKYKSLTFEQIRQRLLSGVDPLSDMSKTTITNGRLNLFNLLEDDTTPPAAVSNLAVSGVLMTKINLRWTATGDDDMEGNANAYDIRYSRSPITDATWQIATRVPNAPTPGAPGTTEEFSVGGLEPDTTYYFALRVLDNVGNSSELSNGVMASTSAGTIVFEDDMESGEGDWVTEGTDDLWHLSSLRFNSPVTAWYYGQDESRNYDTGEINNGTLTSPPISLVDADDILLTFHEWSEVQSSTRFDRTRVQVSSDGVAWKTVFESHGTKDEWEQRTVSLAEFVDPTSTIQIRFWFDTVSSTFNNFEGWYIDDVRLLTAKLELPGDKVPMPNLVVEESNIGFSPSNPVEGERVRINATILNNGTTEANDVIVQFVDITDGGAVPIGQPQTISNLPVGGSGMAQVSYGRDTVAGELEIQAIVDPNNFIAEQNESDNAASRILTIAPAPAPNLVIQSANIGFEPTTPTLGDQVTVRATILNDGAVEVNDVVVQFLDTTGTGSTPIGEPQTIDQIASGGSATVQVTYDTTGVHEDRSIEVVVDPGNAIAESDEDDNDAEADLELAPLSAPNLVVEASNIGFSPSNPLSGDPVTINVTVLNNGTAEATDVQVQFVDSTTTGSIPIAQQQTIEVIPAGGSGVAQVTYNTANRSGDRKIEVIVDPHNFIPEEKETDNDAKATLTITPLPTPNLVALDNNIGFNPPKPVEGDLVTIDATVLNHGTTAVTDVAVQFVDVSNGGSTPIGERQMISEIGAGASGSVQVTYATTDLTGARQIQIVVDPNNFIREADESDNEAKASLTIAAAPAPNLVMLSNNIKFHPMLPVEGDEVRISALVLNNGSAPAEDVLVQFIDITSGTAVPIGREMFIDFIAIGESGSVEVTYKTDNWDSSRKIQVLVDSNNLIAETNEGDNEAMKTLAVTAGSAANLVMLPENIGFNPSEANDGEMVLIHATVLNRGTTDASNIVVQFVNVTTGRPLPIGQPQLIESIPMGASGTTQVTLDTSGQAGEHRIRVLVDPTNFIVETDETDNRATQTLMVNESARSNLLVQSANIGFNPTRPVEGEPVSMTVTIQNDGSVDADGVLVQFADVTDGTLQPVDKKQIIDLIPAGGTATVQGTYETMDKVGERKIQVLVDPHSTIPELNERDNTAIQTLMVAAPPAPNLVVHDKNIGFSSITPITGDDVTIHASIRNNGDADAQNVSVQFVDVTDGGAVPIGTNQIIVEIPVGGSSTVEIGYSTVGLFGDRKIQVIADRNNLLVESSEKDNVAKATLTVGLPTIPNLVMLSSNIGFDPVTPNPGDQVTIFATILNNGTADASDIAVQFVDTTNSSSLPMGQPQTIETIPAGGSATVQITYDTAQFASTNSIKVDDRKIKVVVDPNNFIREAKESDNEAQKTLELIQPAAPDLVASASNIGFSPSEPQVGDEVTVHAVVRNEGNLEATDVVVQFLIENEDEPLPIGPPQTIDIIPVGGTGFAQVTIPSLAAIDKLKIEVVVDPGNFVAEPKETNNSASKSVNVAPSPAANLFVRSANIGFNPRTPTEGDLVTVNAVILNTGTVDVNDVVVQFIDATDGGAVPIGIPQLISTIRNGSSGVAQILYDTTDLEGERPILVVVDPNNFIAESDEDDNQAAEILTVVPPPAPNLMVVSGNLKFEPAVPEAGEPVTMSMTVLNDGTADASEVLVQFVDITNDGAVPIGAEQVIDALPAGSSATVQVIYNNTDVPGERRIQVTVDPTDSVTESNESDNRAVKKLTITAPTEPNLSVGTGDIAFDTTNPLEGDPVVITVTVHNKGTADANNVEVTIVDITEGSDLIGGLQTIETIGAGENAEVSVTYQTGGKVGRRSIRVTVDPDNTIDESDEDDNQATKTLTVKSPEEEPADLPNLAIKSSGIVFDPTNPEPGTTVTITITVDNDGSADATDPVVKVEDVTDEDSVTLIGQKQITGTIESGESGTTSMTYDTTGLEDDRTIRVTVDPGNDIEESDEEDNVATKTLTFGSAEEEEETEDSASRNQEGSRASLHDSQQANLIVDPGDIQFERQNEERDGPLVVSATIRNIGDAAARDVMVQFVDVTDGNANLIGGAQIVASLPGRSSDMVEIRYDLHGDSVLDREIQVVLDPYNIIAEADEGDNVASRLTVADAGSDGLQVAVED